MAWRFSILLLLGGVAFAQSDLTQASLEQLMNIEVTSVSKKEQRLSDTAASVYVITAEDIRRSGIQTLPELLRLAPGVTVERISAGTWAISIRGFTDQFDNKLLVLVDGRSIYNEYFAGVFWDLQQIAPEDIERIEVIRGAAAAMWGINAVNGVINIITRKTGGKPGGSVTAATGTGGETDVSARYSGDLGSAAAYRVGFRNTDQSPFVAAQGTAPTYGWASTGANLRVDWTPDGDDTFLFLAEAGQSNTGHLFSYGDPNNPLAQPFNGQIQKSDVDGTVRWDRVLSERSSVEGQASFTYVDSRDPQTPVHYSIMDAEFKHHIQLGSRNDVVWGVSARVADFSLSANAPIQVGTPSGYGQDTYSVFGEDEFMLVPDKLHLIAGARADHNSFTGFDVQPTARLLWTPTAKSATWAAVSLADRAPSLYERGFDSLAESVPLGADQFGYVRLLGDPSFRSETVLDYEAGERVQMGARWSLDVSSYFDIYHRLQGYAVGAPLFVAPTATQASYLEIPVTMGNLRHGNIYGGELSATFVATPRWKLTGGYGAVIAETRSYAGPTLDAFDTNGATPRHQAQARSNFDLTRKIQIDAAMYFNTSTFFPGELTSSTTTIPHYFRGDLRIGWRPVEWLDLSAGVQDAFTPLHAEFLDGRFPELMELRRNIYVSATWRF